MLLLLMLLLLMLLSFLLQQYRQMLCRLQAPRQLQVA
jgi:hypothetical protein